MVVAWLAYESRRANQMTAPPRQATTRHTSDILFLLAAGGSAALAYAAMLVRLPLLELYATRLKILNYIPISDWPTGVLIIGCVVLLFAGYAIGAASTAAAERSGHAWIAIIGFPLLFAGLLVFVFPLSSTDMYDYLFRGRMLVHYGSNPYTEVPKSFQNDPLMPYVAWKYAVSAYGPIWEDMSAVVAWLAGELPGAPADPRALLLGYLLGYKMLAVLGYLLCAGAIWAVLRDAAPRYRWLGVYLWLWNPLVLWETAVNGHNDVWLALWIIVALWLFGWSKRPGAAAQIMPYALALLALTVAGLIKFVALFAGPLVLVAALRRLPTMRARLRLVVIGGGACVALLALAYAPFWEGLATLKNIGTRRTLYNASWLAALEPILRERVGKDSSMTLAASIGLALLAIGIGWGCWRAWRAPEEVGRHVLGLILWFLLICNAWFEPWYVVWLVALAAIQPWRRRELLAAAVFCCTALMMYVIDGLVLPALQLKDGSSAREGLIATFVYLPPLIVLCSGWLARLGVVLRRSTALGARRPPTIEGESSGATRA
jgi:hypothetical protein